MAGSSIPEPAVSPGEDPRRYAMLLSAVYDATMSGDRAPARPRAVIEDSWNRLRAKGINPDHHIPPQVDTSGLDLLRQQSGLIAVLDDVSRGLDSVIEEGDNILVVADARGRVLWRSGSPRVLSLADRLGFIEGATWSENAVGTNGIGTALASHRAVQIFSAEHFLRTHHPWTCAGAPIRDPRTGQVIGIVDVSGPASTVHPTTVALVDLVARLAESHLREAHDRTLNRLRAVAAPILARVGSPALAVDTEGWVAAVDCLPLHNRILLPESGLPGRVWIPPLGMCDVEGLPGGWLVRVADDAEPSAAPSRVILDLRDGEPSLEMSGQFGSWRRSISSRHAEILLVLATSRQGRSAPELAEDLYGDRSRVVTVRAEMSRLRKQFVGLVAGKPYRFGDSVVVDVRYPQDMSSLLASSTAPAVHAARRYTLT
ncbi:GAF domain-containing protein [Mycolicibacterium nivoides]|uniref:GAF domain-containing protein n=1 Tax=Mycolicibacterium nivoides TaxID=2487344 RepID=UPI00147E3E88|nr:GAF domain-containing protein [Mycolicibacterium nivoides]MBN3509782.1 GAF domain-containing protein [Mycolicibacterium septicum]QRY48342.1 GAF domain-containing protein [Mycolicibacterium boenickei]